MRKALTLLILALSLSVFAGAAEIASADDMLTLMNTPSMWADGYVLTADIDLADATNGLPQAPVGNTDNPFTGTFDGDRHTISGIALTDYTTEYVALFGYVSGATIENLTVEGTVSSSGSYVAGVAGGVDGASVTVKNCINRCSVTGKTAVAGIIARIDAGKDTAHIFGCKNEGTITSNSNYAGGILAISTQNGATITLEQCMNTGAVSASGKYVGGIVGFWRVYSASANKCTLQDCINTAPVYAAQTAVGGIVGAGNGQNYAYTLTRCFNSGSITAGGSAYVRPIAGAISKATNSAGQMTYCYYSSTDSYTTDATGYSAANETYVADVTVAASFAGLGENWIVADGYAPELKVFHEHTYTDGVCEKCGADFLCTHENKYEVVETEATCSGVGSKYEFCPDCQTKVSGDIEIAVDSDNHSGTVAMTFKNGTVTYTCADCSAVVYTDNSLLDTVYVSENGRELSGVITGQIGTSANPFKNFTDAMQYAAYCGNVTVNIIDRASVPKNYETPTFDGTITVTGGTLETNNRFSLNGDFVFENIVIAPSVALVMAAKEHKLVMGEGITMSGSDVYLVGGYENGLNTNSDIPATGFVTDITIRSGKYNSVGGGNRFLDGAYSGTINMTLGKTNANDTLEITSTLVTGSLNYDGGDGVTATVIFDGDVDKLVTFRPITHPSSPVAGRFDVDVVVKGTAVVNAGDIHLRGQDYAINVYADSRVEGAEEFAAKIVGEENVQPYKRYCIKVNGIHPDANEDTICDNCGASTECEHESGEWHEIAKANCTNYAEYMWYCFDCQELIEAMTKTGEVLDSDNHVSAGGKWEYKNGVYFLGCVSCGEGIEQTTSPAVYVASNGNNDYDGTTAERAVATVEEAVARISDVGGTVVIVGSYALSDDLVLPAYSKPVTFSGYDADNGYIHGGFKLSKLTVISLGGETKFDNISFDGNACVVFECNWNNAEFGKIEVVNNAYSYVVAGGYKITGSDFADKETAIKITENATYLISREGTLSRNRFYANVYLGSSFAAEEISVSNKTVNFDAKDADIGVLYTMSTSSTYRNNPVTNCETTVNLYGRTVIEKGRTGDFNARYAESTARLDTLTLNFFDNSYVSMDCYIRNAADTVINVSAAKDGREVSMGCPFTFYAYGSFADENTPVNVEINCGTHSFALSVGSPCMFEGTADALKVYSENITSECEYTSKATVAATPDEKGTLLYSCTCGRSYTEEYEYSCEAATHVYVAKDGGYECTVCGESFAYYSGDNTFAAEATAAEEEKVTANVSVKGTFAAALVNIKIPEGYTLGEVILPENENFIVAGGVNNGTYVLTILSSDGTAKAVNISFDITLAGIGEGMIEVTVPELYDGGGNTLVATAVSAEIPEYVEELLPGDMDGDGVLTVLDALTILKMIVNGALSKLADVNEDGTVNLTDAIRIFKEIAKQ